MRLKPQKGAWILGVLFLMGVVFPVFSPARAADNNQLVFAYQSANVYQDVITTTFGKTSLTFTVSAAETQDWKVSSDLLNIGIALYGSGGGLIYQHSTGDVAIDSTQFSNYSITVNKSGVGTGGWSSVEKVQAFIIGQDGEFWAGNYGTRIESASLKFDDNIELLSNNEFINTDYWNTSLGWQSCSGGAGGSPCISSTPVPTTTTIPTTNSQYTLGTDMVWGTVNEGWNLTLTAPGGGIFSEVTFASYGTPSGSNGIYTQGSCHSTSSILKVSQVFIGQTTATIAANNGVFGDPCGGTYKNLRVVLKYTGGSPNIPTTTTTTTLPPPTCGPYANITVTGKYSGGAVWGSGPYTDDSDMDVAAVHAGLVEPGETKTLVPTNIAYHQSYPGSTANGVTTVDWLAPWCGYDLTLATPPTTTTTSTTTTSTTSTTVVPSTTTTILVPIPTTTVPVTTTPTTVIPTTTEPATTTTTVVQTTTTTTQPVVEIKEEMSQEEAVTAATDQEVLKEATKEEAAQIFSSIDTSEITEEQKSEIIDAVQNASEEVKEAFEEEINVYADGFDNYVPVGSVIDVGTRRSLIAATTVLSTVTVAGATSGGSSPSPKPTPSSGGGSGPDPNSAAKKDEDDDEDEEEAAEIEGPEGDEEENTFTRNSIFNYQEGTMKRTFNPWGFIKKFAKETAALAFTISGTVIVFATLSGDTRKITLIATSCAFAVHYLNAMLKNDE